MVKVIEKKEAENLLLNGASLTNQHGRWVIRKTDKLGSKIIGKLDVGVREQLHIEVPLVRLAKYSESVWVAA